MALAKIKNGIKDRTTKDNFQPLYKAYTVQATAVVKEFTTTERREPVAWKKKTEHFMNIPNLKWLCPLNI